MSDEIMAALARIEGYLGEQDRKLEAVISVLPFHYRNTIRKALDGPEAERPARPAKRSTAIRAAVIGPARRT